MCVCVCVCVCVCTHLRFCRAPTERRALQVYEKWPLPAERPAASDDQAYMLYLTKRGAGACLAAGFDLRPIAAAAQGLATFKKYDVKGRVMRETKLPVDPQRPAAAMLYAPPLVRTRGWLCA